MRKPSRIFLFLLVSVLAVMPAAAQSGLQYDILQDVFDQVVGAPVSNGIDIDVDGVQSGFAAMDISVGANGALWYIGLDGSIYEMTDAGAQKRPGAARRIAVDPAGRAWVANSNGTIYRWTGSAWQTMPGGATDIGIGRDGTVWVTGMDGLLWTWAGNGWIAGAERGIAVGVDAQSQPWVINAKGAIFQKVPEGWRHIQGWGSDLAVGTDGVVWVIGSGGRVWRWDGSWSVTPIVGTRIAAGDSSNIWVARGDQPVVRLGN